MNRIDQHNYELFFLQYVDGELSAADRKAVEAFAEANPDLAFELEQLSDARLLPETVPFPDKHSLYRHQAPTGEIGLDNYESYLLLSVDKELSDTDEKSLESFLLHHPEKTAELSLFLQTRLPDEPIIFADKASLYRTDRKKPVIFPHWQRWAAAAVIAGLVFSVRMLVPDSSNPSLKNMPVAKTPVTETPYQKAPDAGKEETAETKTVENKKEKPGLDIKPAVQQNTDLAVVHAPKEAPPTVQQTDITEMPVTDNSREAKADPVVTAAAQGSFDTRISRTTQVSGSNPVAENMEPPSYAKQVVYRELDTDTHDEDKTLLLGSLEINKDKLRGLFRKAASLLHSKNKPDDERYDDPSPKKARSLK